MYLLIIILAGICGFFTAMLCGKEGSVILNQKLKILGLYMCTFNLDLIFGIILWILFVILI